MAPPSPLQRAAQWLDAVKLLVGVCLTLVAAYGQVLVTNAERDHRIAILEAWKAERILELKTEAIERREMLVLVTETRATLKALEQRRDR